jgi:hypothetical protein
MKTLTRQPQKHPGGRPPKFAEPRRPITVTLPDATLQQLTEIDADRAHAIVKATEAALNLQGAGQKLVQVVEVALGSGLIIVGPNRHLKKIPWLRMAEIAPARFLLSIPSGMPVDSLEIALADILDDVPASEQRERKMLMELREMMRSLRRGQKVTKAEILFVNTMKKGHAA